MSLIDWMYTVGALAVSWLVLSLPYLIEKCLKSA
jgi:hypothetical protein